MLFFDNNAKYFLVDIQQVNIALHNVSKNDLKYDYRLHIRHKTMTKVAKKDPPSGKALGGQRTEQIVWEPSALQLYHNITGGINHDRRSGIYSLLHRPAVQHGGTIGAYRAVRPGE